MISSFLVHTSNSVRRSGWNPLNRSIGCFFHHNLKREVLRLRSAAELVYFNWEERNVFRILRIRSDFGVQNNFQFLVISRIKTIYELASKGNFSSGNCFKRISWSLGFSNDFTSDFLRERGTKKKRLVRTIAGKSFVILRRVMHLPANCNRFATVITLVI